MPDSGEKHSDQQNERVGFTTFQNRNGAAPAVAADALLNERGEAQMNGGGEAVLCAYCEGGCLGKQRIDYVKRL